jgi:L-ascorbate metabolism protein UlaG (beta-lactamase superfamily)
MRFFPFLFLVCFTLCSWASEKPSAAQAVTVRWYGHGFIYLISSTGVRVAIDPFQEESLDYKFPARLPADVVLISNESDFSSAADKLFGNPQVFRSTTAVGMNKACGHLFKGVQTFRDAQRGNEQGTNTAFSFQLDGLRFVHLGAIGHVPDSAQLRLLGPADVLFLPTGNRQLSVEELDRIIVMFAPRVIIPMAYATAFTSKVELRKPEDFFDKKPNLKRIESSEISLSPTSLPSAATFYLLQVPIASS